MKTNWTSWHTGEKAELHKMTSGEVFAVITKNGYGTQHQTFASVAQAREFFASENGWH